MVKIKVVGKKVQVTEITCHRCGSVLEVNEYEWKDGGYGSERRVDCPVCKSSNVKPGTEYRGDF